MRIRRRGKAILSVLAIYISVTGLVTLSLFICEESIQWAMFGTWRAQDAKDWELVRFGCERMRDANTLMKTINYSLGWIQPLAFLAYRAFSESTDSYIWSLEARIFANAPEIFAGKTMTFAFTPQTVAETKIQSLFIDGEAVEAIAYLPFGASLAARATGGCAPRRQRAGM
jgi:hypothetical protein